jgi:hypothetical protein
MSIILIKYSLYNVFNKAGNFTPEMFNVIYGN